MSTQTLYTKMYDQRTDGGRHVRSITLTGSPILYEVSSQGVLHWRIYIQIAGSTKSVLLDMSPGSGADLRTGILAISSKNYESSNSTVALFDSPVITTITVEQLIGFLLEKGMSRYRFDATGSGCRHWCSVALGHLEDARVIGKGARAQFEQYIRDKAQTEPAKYPLPTRIGTFY